MLPIKSKHEYHDLLAAGVWFNTNHRWYDVKKWDKENTGGLGNVKTVGTWVTLNTYEVTRLWGIQTIGQPGGRWEPNVPTTQVTEVIRGWKGKYVISPMLPDEHLIVQGEILDDYLFSSTALLPMRQALREQPEHRDGVVAKEYLKYLLPYDDLEDIMTLQELYPGHVIEFSTYNVPVGQLKRRTVTWEVRGGY